MKDIKNWRKQELELENYGSVEFSEDRAGKWMVEFRPFSSDHANNMLIKLPVKDGGSYIKALKGLLDFGQQDYPNQAADL